MELELKTNKGTENAKENLRKFEDRMKHRAISQSVFIHLTKAGLAAYD